ncbi:MAG: hypothetical protein JKX99_09420 [Robiginitomaculum sp.]|nr:hypothetical protein [Robiginitomaculum sp.]
MCKPVLGFLLCWIGLVGPAFSAPLDARQRDLIEAAAIYTSLSFSVQNREARRKNLPLSEAEYQRLDQLLPPRFQACMEGGFAVAFPDLETARTLRQLMQSISAKQQPEPDNADIVLPGFLATNQWCSARIPLWTSAILN